MRLRNIPGADEAIAESPYCINEPETQKGNWQQLFGNDNPIHIEIGMGKGQFLTRLAKENPHINYIGIERYSSVLLRALQKMEQEPLSNLRFLCIDAASITEIFEKNEVDKIYLNFSDPWPKARHARRRLTSRQYFERYDKILAYDGVVEFKTDNRDRFDCSLEQIDLAGWVLLAKTYDLHNDPTLSRGNVMTEYEEKFSGLGHPIHKLIAMRQ